MWQVTCIDPAQFPLPLCCMRASCNIEDAHVTLSRYNFSAFSRRRGIIGKVLKYIGPRAMLGFHGTTKAIKPRDTVMTSATMGANIE